LSHPKLVVKGEKLFFSFADARVKMFARENHQCHREKKRMQKVQMGGIFSNLPVFLFSFAGIESDWGPLPQPEVCNI
jgi:hypothetical protein